MIIIGAEGEKKAKRPGNRATLLYRQKLSFSESSIYPAVRFSEPCEPAKSDQGRVVDRVEDLKSDLRPHALAVTVTVQDWRGVPKSSRTMFALSPVRIARSAA